jgi:hypothetical protein
MYIFIIEKKNKMEPSLGHLAQALAQPCPTPPSTQLHVGHSFSLYVLGPHMYVPLLLPYARFGLGELSRSLSSSVCPPPHVLIVVPCISPCRWSRNSIFSRVFHFFQGKLIYFLFKNWKSHRKIGCQTSP